ncbi:aminotransferase class III [candidate division WOR-1 bacterium RIFOXYC2_FULL_37_10]|uniref:Aminotransferase class III n=1 Tax=candidate division WOR-1 bacterium RIFOXYB2_FULL_37_13 TaxID=1802579 RepID=A0A1F4SQ78_UNCSA|nr:MAG: aminotransferase class III [candidate division WOR-1 bacterium RIFOXYB2_FULL_37_13]OGC34234.1 MAG: aminotransferase class III [candidate division WOR-1 bacterium RIFOXYC2_FULL_37_10]
MGISQELYKKAKKIIPGGTQLFSKRPEMFLPDLWPAYYSKAKGCEVWDLDNKKYIDMSYMGIGSCILGYSDDDVNLAVDGAVTNGNMCTLNAPEEVELAELLCELHPWAEMVRYARCGGEAMSIAVRIARAATGKDIILFCGYHGWHDWYLSANLADDQALDGHLLQGLFSKGVPRGLLGTAKPFIYNNTEQFLDLINKNKGKIAAVVVETIRNYEPKPGFLETIRKVTDELKIVMICDEVSSGWRLNVGGAHLKYGISPDIAVFAKGISNGFPMAAIIGKSDVMQAAQETFISSTYWTDRIGPTAAIAAIKKMKANDVPRYLSIVGSKIKKGWSDLANKYHLKISVSGIDPLGHFSFNYDNHLYLKTLFTQLMLEKGFLATNAFYASFSHTEQCVDSYLMAVDESLAFISESLKNDSVVSDLKGLVCHAGFKRLE